MHTVKGPCVFVFCVALLVLVAENVYDDVVIIVCVIDVCDNGCEQAAAVHVPV